MTYSQYMEWVRQEDEKYSLLHFAVALFAYGLGAFAVWSALLVLVAGFGHLALVPLLLAGPLGLLHLLLFLIKRGS